MNKETYKKVFECRMLLDKTVGLEVGPSDNPMIAGRNVTYMDRDSFGDLSPMIKHDLEDIPYPFDDCSFDIIAAREVLEHVCPKNILGVMGELHRILKSEGALILTVPYYKWKGAFSTPDHCNYFTEDSFVKYISRGQYRGELTWRIKKILRVREKDRLRFMPIQSSGKRIGNKTLRKIVYRILSYMPFKWYTRNLYVEIQPIKSGHEFLYK